MNPEMTLCFVGASRGNAFMNELLAAIAHEVAAAGMPSEVVLDALPPEPRAAYVLVPHEYYATVRPKALHPTREQLGRTIALCTEQPGTPWFEVGESHARLAACVVDIHREAARELCRRGVPAEHFRLGYSAFWDRWRREESAERPLDVLHLGAVTDRRLEALAGYGATLWSRETRLHVPPEAAKSRERPDFSTGESKWRLLRDSKTLLNIHRQPTTYFEWVRVLEAIANGCVVVSEHSAECAPLVPGEHFASGSLENLGLLADGLLRDEPRLAATRLAAYDLVRDDLPMRPSAERLAAIAESLARSPRRRARQARSERRLRHAAGELARRATEDPRIDSVVHQQRTLVKWSRRADAGLKRVVLGQIELSRRIAAQSAALRGEDADEVREVARTPAYARSRPRVSVCIPLHNHAEEVRAALASVAASELVDVEAVVLDDASSDRSQDAVLDFFHEHPFLSGLLLRHVVNRGLGRTRNDLLAASRAEYVFMLDADNEVYPTALTRLVRALDADPGAFFAYPMLEVHFDGEPETLRSFLPWEPELLQAGNYIDAMALLRREDLLELGGYAEDLRLYGWEDYELWCRAADRGLRGVLVPQILARYRRASHSMLAVTDVDTTEAEAILRARYPSLRQKPAVTDFAG